MSLRERIIIILFLIFCSYAGLEYIAYHRLIYPVFARQEEQQAQAAAENVLKIIRGEFADMQHHIAQQAGSGQLYQRPAGTAMNLQKPHDALDLMVTYDHRWNITGRHLPESLSLADFEQVIFSPKQPLIAKNQMGFSKQGLMRFGDTCAYVVAEPILAASNSTTVEGMVIAGTFLADPWLRAVRTKHRLSFNWTFVISDLQRDRNAGLLNQLTPEASCSFSPVNEQFFECSTALFDKQHNPVLLIKSMHEKTITKEGKATIDKLMLMKLSMALAAILFLTVLLQMAVIGPIKKLIEHVVRFGQPGDNHQKIALSRNDEIGKLAAEFDRMSQRLQNAQIKLMEKSYVSGAAEMSSGILHNVRNALSPITTQIERIKDQFQDIPLQNLEQARSELQTGALSPQRREDLMRFVELTFQHVLTNLTDMVGGLEELSGQVSQIEDMLNHRRTFGSRRDRSLEPIEPLQLLNNALEIVPEKFRDNNRIQVHPNVRTMPPVPVHPTTFIQILQNLLINAAESLDRERPLCPRVKVNCTVDTHDGQDMLHWTFHDNGIGIEPDKLNTIFERGASSKEQGLTGIGLHWCANTINAIQGRLWAESDGLHRGACFHLLVPLTEAESLAATHEH